MILAVNIFLTLFKLFQDWNEWPECLVFHQSKRNELLVEARVFDRPWDGKSYEWLFDQVRIKKTGKVIYKLEIPGPSFGIDSLPIKIVDNSTIKEIPVYPHDELPGAYIFILEQDKGVYIQVISTSALFANNKGFRMRKAGHFEFKSGELSITQDSCKKLCFKYFAKWNMNTYKKATTPTPKK